MMAGPLNRPRGGKGKTWCADIPGGPQSGQMAPPRGDPISEDPGPGGGGRVPFQGAMPTEPPPGLPGGPGDLGPPGKNQRCSKAGQKQGANGQRNGGPHWQKNQPPSKPSLGPGGRPGQRGGRPRHPGFNLQFPLFTRGAPIVHLKSRRLTRQGTSRRGRNKGPFRRFGFGPPTGASLII